MELGKGVRVEVGGGGGGCRVEMQGIPYVVRCFDILDLKSLISDIMQRN